MRFEYLRSLNDVAPGNSDRKEYGKIIGKTTRRNLNVRAVSKIHDRLRRARKSPAQETTSADKPILDSTACNTPFVDRAFCDDIIQKESSERHYFHDAGPPGSLHIPRILPTHTGMSTNLNKATYKNIANKPPQVLDKATPNNIHTLTIPASSSTSMKRMGRIQKDAKIEASEEQSKKESAKNETGPAEKSTHNSLRSDLRGGPCKPRSRERRYLSSGVPQIGQGLGGVQSSRNSFPKRRLGDGRYSVVPHLRTPGTGAPLQKDLEGQVILNMRRVEDQNETRSAYDVGEAMDPEVNDCFCEYRSHVKCLGEGITKIPSRIVGNVTWL